MSEMSPEGTLTTINALEDRLRRLEWYLAGNEESGDTLQSQGRDGTVQARLGKLEHDLNKLASKSPVVHNLLKLQSTYPDLFHPSISGPPTTLSAAELLAIITSCATSFPTTASRLNAIKDLPVPSAESSASLIALQPRLVKVEMRQDEQAEEMTELRKRSASTIQRWYELGVLGESECWTEWEGRLVSVEKRVRRQETHQAQEAKESAVYQAG